MYDILFDSMAHMFQNAYQDKPLDLVEQAGNFYARRRETIETLLKQIETDIEEAVSILERNFVIHKGEKIEGVNWTLVGNQRILGHICRGIGGSALSTLLRMMS